MDQCRVLAESLPSNVRWRFAGHVAPRAVIPFFVANTIDVFVNVSSTEGLPFSVMEAFSAGIPVFATDVGGTAEIVDDTVGRILPEAVTPEALSAAFCEFHEQTPAKIQQLRDAAYQRYSTGCDARVLTAKLARALIGLS
jgi:glycosyltransferase involved in cell wall biosynthesis